MTKGGPSLPSQRAEKVGGVRPLAAMVCALRGNHDYVASRRFEGFDTCIHCAHRRTAGDRSWFATELKREATSSGGDSEAGMRPMALLGCAIRRHHDFVPSRRLEGYDTCMHCGSRRKALDKTWFAVAPPRPAPSADEAVDPDIAEDAHASVVVIPFAAEPHAGAPASGVDPKVLRQFLRRIDKGFAEGHLGGLRDRGPPARPQS
jgi:hypothetical protein